MTKPNRVQQVLANKGDAIDDTGIENESLPSEGMEQALASGPTRIDRIRMGAYAAAERRGFQPGHEEADWLHAEREVDAQGPQEEEPGTAD